jgi:hydroxyquinol 1,2-dioxygenase
MHHIDEDNITQAVIARHAAAGDARLREVMTSLVQHLHAFAREVKLSEDEWAGGIHFLAECGRRSSSEPQELRLLSDALGLSMLATALNQRKPKGCTEATAASPLETRSAAARHGEAQPEPCYVRGSVRALDGAPIADAEVHVGQADGGGWSEAPRTDADGRFVCQTRVASPQPIAHDGPVGRLLQALGRHPWRPAHLHFKIKASGCERLVTQVFRRGDPYLDSDAVFGVRSSLVADWVRHEPGRTPDGHDSKVPFTTLDFVFVLNPTTGDKP